MTHPEDQLDPRLAARLDQLDPVPPRDPEQARLGRERFLAELERLGPPQRLPLSERIRRWLGLMDGSGNASLGWQRSFAPSLLAIVIVLALLSGGLWVTAATAQTSLPGDALFLVKTGLEDAQVTLSRDAANDAELHLQFAKNRLDEIAALIAAGRYADLPAATGQFERHIQRAIQSLTLVAKGDPARAELLASSITEALINYSQILSGLLVIVPAPAQTPLADALQFSDSTYRRAEVKFDGIVQAIASGRWTIADRQVTVTSETKIEGPIGIGDLVQVEAEELLDASLRGREIKLLEKQDDQTEASEVRFTGVVEAINAATWIINGRTVAINADTEIKDTIAVGDTVSVRALQTPDGSLQATRIELEDRESEPGEQIVQPTPQPTPQPEPEQEPEQEEDGEDEDEEVRFTGILQAIAGDTWTVDGQQVLVNAQTEIDGNAGIGDRVEVRARRKPDGRLIAEKIERKENQEDEEVKFTGVVESLGSDRWIVAGQTVMIKSGTEIEGQIAVGDKVEVIARRKTDGSLSADEIRLLEKQGGGDDDGEDGEEGSSEVKIKGPVSSIGPNAWTIAGQTVAVNAQTEIKDEISVGDAVEVKALRNADGSLTAIEIEEDD